MADNVKIHRIIMTAFKGIIGQFYANSDDSTSPNMMIVRFHHQIEIPVRAEEDPKNWTDHIPLTPLAPLGSQFTLADLDTSKSINVTSSGLLSGQGYCDCLLAAATATEPPLAGSLNAQSVTQPSARRHRNADRYFFATADRSRADPRRKRALRADVCDSGYLSYWELKYLRGHRRWLRRHLKYDVQNFAEARIPQSPQTDSVL
ncbi:hypothetical protein SprV_0200871200 [Sparganum proliferum]